MASPDRICNYHKTLSMSHRPPKIEWRIYLVNKERLRLCSKNMQLLSPSVERAVDGQGGERSLTLAARRMNSGREGGRPSMSQPVQHSDELPYIIRRWQWVIDLRPKIGWRMRLECAWWMRRSWDCAWKVRGYYRRISRRTGFVGCGWVIFETGNPSDELWSRRWAAIDVAASATRRREWKSRRRNERFT